MRAITFFPVVLRLNGGQFEGRKFDLHPSQAFRIGSLFGWKQADGTRRFRRFYDEEGKGNGKSPLLAGIGLYCLLADGEARAEVYAAGSKKDQAMVLFRDAVAMVDQSPALAARLTKSGGNPVWNLADLRTGSFFRPISSDEGQSGPRPSCALCDEVHEHRDARTVELLERGFKWRRQPLLVMATNSGTDRNSICWQEHEHAVRVAAGTRTPDANFTYVGEVIDDETFSFVCTLDADDDPLNDPSCWIKANPLLGVTVTEAYLAGVVRQAKAIPGKLNNILRLHFCQWTDAEESWMSRAALEAVLADFDPLDLSGDDAYAGLDLSGSQDLTALAVVVATGMVDVPRDDGSVARLPTFDAWIEAWTPRDTMAERALRDQQPYDVWAEQGYPHEHNSIGNYPPPCHGLQSLNPWGMDRIDLQRLSREELIELVLALQGPAKTSRTSSKPPSTDKKEKRENSRPGGAKPGHEPHNRRLTDNPDEFRDHKPTVCGRCGGGFAADADMNLIGE